MAEDSSSNGENSIAFNGSLEKGKEPSLVTNSGNKLKKFVCLVCNYNTNKKYHLKRHLQIHSENNDTAKKYKKKKCSLCNFKSILNQDLKRHLETKHFNSYSTNVFTCSECRYKGNTNYSLNMHILNEHTNGEKLYKCSTCSYVTNYKSSLNVHLNTHTDTKLFQCSQCSYECNYKQSLKTHHLNHHIRVKKENDNVIPDKSNDQNSNPLKKPDKQNKPHIAHTIFVTDFDSIAVFKCSECDLEVTLKEK